MPALRGVDLRRQRAVSSVRPLPVERGRPSAASLVGPGGRGRVPGDGVLVGPEFLLSMRGTSALRVAWVYDMNACLSPTGVTRHALGQLDLLAKRPEVSLTVVSGRITEPDGLAAWERLDGLDRRQLPLSTRDALRFWRVTGGPPLEWWTGDVD